MTFHMVELAVGDLGRSVAWYRNVLDFRVSLLDEPNGFALLELAGGRLALKRGIPGTGATLHFEVPDLPAEVGRLAALGVEAGDPKRSAEGYVRVRLADPDGYAVVLFQWTR